MTGYKPTLNNNRARASREGSMEFGAFMRSMEEERNQSSKGGSNIDKNSNTANEGSMDLGGLGKNDSPDTHNDTFDSKIHLNDLPSQSHWGFMGSFRRRMSNSMGFHRRRSSVTKTPASEKSRKKLVKFKFFESSRNERF